MVAAAAPWHPGHDAARVALRGVDALIAHVELEAYSVLTRLPEPHRVADALAAKLLRERYPGARLVLSARDRKLLIDRFAVREIGGGAAYDALVASVAAAHDAVLLTRDRRATRTYSVLDAAFEIVG